MSRLQLAAFTALVLCHLAVFPLAAQELTIDLGSKVEGTVPGPGAAAVLLFEAIAGEEVSITVKAGKGSDLKPSIAIVHATSGEELESALAKKRNVSLKKVPIVETGTYALQITGAEGTHGDYQAKTKTKVGKEASKPASEPGSGAAGSVAVRFSAAQGTELSFVVRPDKKSDASPGQPVLKGPSGTVDMGGPFEVSKSGQLKVKGFVLPAFGAYELEVDNEGVANDDLVIQVKLKAPKRKKVTILANALASGFDLTPDVIFDDSGSVTLAVQAALRPLKPKIDQVQLLVERDGAVEVLGVLTDDGDLLNGDDVAEDLVFSGRFPFDAGSSPLGQFPVWVEVDYKGNRVGRAAPEGLRVVRDFSEEELEVIVEAQTELQDLLDAAVGEGDLGATLDEIEGELQALVAAGDVLGFGRHNTGDDATGPENGFWVMYASGAAAVISSNAAVDAGPDPAAPIPGGGSSLDWRPSVRDYLQDLRRAKQAEVMGVAPPTPRLVTSALGPVAGHHGGPAQPESDGLAGDENGVVNVVGSNFVRVISTNKHLLGESDAITAIADALEEDGCWLLDSDGAGSGGSSISSGPGTGSVADFAGLGGYGILLIGAEADAFFQGADFGLVGDTFSYPGEPVASDASGLLLQDSVVVLDSNETWLETDLPTPEQNEAAMRTNLRKYAKDLKDGRVVLWGRNFGVTGRFIKRYAAKNSMPESLVFLNASRGVINDDLSKNFFKRGAAAVLGFTDYVSPAFAMANGPSRFETLLDPRMRVGDAFPSPLMEQDATPASLLVVGGDRARNLNLDPTQLTDGFFESGAANAAWISDGDVSFVGQLGQDTPTEGNLMARITTGLGGNTISGVMGQLVCLPDDATELSFDWNMFSAEWVCYCGYGFQDRFSVDLIDPLDAMNPANLFERAIDDLCGVEKEVNNHPCGPDFTNDFGPTFAYKKPFVKPAKGLAWQPGDVDGVWTTGWQIRERVPIPEELRGQDVIVSFLVTDVGDSIFDSAVLIDAVEILTEGDS